MARIDELEKIISGKFVDTNRPQPRFLYAATCRKLTTAAGMLSKGYTLAEVENWILDQQKPEYRDTAGQKQVAYLRDLLIPNGMVEEHIRNYWLSAAKTEVEKVRAAHLLNQLFGKIQRAAEQKDTTQKKKPAAS